MLAARRFATQSSVVWWLAVSTPVAHAQATPTLTTLHDFHQPYGVINSDGISPDSALVQGSDGNFYGTTSSDGDVYHGNGRHL